MESSYLYSTPVLLVFWKTKSMVEWPMSVNCAEQWKERPSNLTVVEIKEKESLRNKGDEIFKKSKGKRQEHGYQNSDSDLRLFDLTIQK